MSERQNEDYGLHEGFDDEKELIALERLLIFAAEQAVLSGQDAVARHCMSAVHSLKCPRANVSGSEQECLMHRNTCIVCNTSGKGMLH